ncbi:MAG: sodium:proline symporter [SAR324 cluster bacterium]|uniref:histidine kinase n=1 Tax=SAR324 cluster bacterium TaxID=2024889 RepID=A0A2A4STD3_9DELT|nr:MAG: sodium:proline symporter [SAR324 cluster bacterium]
MFESTWVLLLLLGYMLLLFLVAIWAENKAKKGKNLADNPLIYSLSLAIYCTTWTYYGSVGKAAASGMLFLPVYLGPTLSMFLWWIVMRKMVRIKNLYRITSLADFISARYGKSLLIGALVSIGALLGTIPYISLQLKSIIHTFQIITIDEPTWIRQHVGLVIVLLMIVFTIVFGLRKIDSAERHQGIIVVIALESFIKLIAIFSVGIFVTYFLFDGIDDIMGQVAAQNHFRSLQADQDNPGQYMTWMSLLILSISAILFLPRQFHVGVVENANEKHISTALWLFPLYLFLINLFVLPIAMGGLLKGLPRETADFFVLLLPFDYGSPLFSLFAFLGGFSAGTSMIIITSMTLSIMVSNYLLLPLADIFPKAGFLKRHLLLSRWLIVASVILLGYWFNLFVGQSEMLVNVGLISFVAILQFAPISLGGLFWEKANKGGCLLGLLSGFFIWFYTLILPSFIRGGLLPKSILNEGPFGLFLLRPEQLLGLDFLDSIPHAVIWSLLFNISFYFLGSLGSEQSEEEQRIAKSYVHCLDKQALQVPSIRLDCSVDLWRKKKIIQNLLAQYYNRDQALLILEEILDREKFGQREKISLLSLLKLSQRVENHLSGVIGAAGAYKALKASDLFQETESKELSRIYGEMMVQMKLTPEDMLKKISYYREREVLTQEIKKQNEELEQRVELRTQELQESLASLRKAQRHLVESEKMASLGGLVSGVAHEINTPIGIGVTAISYLEEQVKKIDLLFHEGRMKRSDLDKFLGIVTNATNSALTNLQRSAELVQSFKEVAVDQVKAIKRDFFFKEYLERVLLSLEPKIKETNHRFILRGPAGIILHNDPGVFMQIVTNLVTNSLLHAFEGIEQGNMTMEFYRKDAEIILTYHDDGIGMSEEQLNHIFDPFFTTKRGRGGIGLGMHIVYNLVTQRLQGTISCHSQEGVGSSFQIHFPI